VRRGKKRSEEREGKRWGGEKRQLVKRLTEKLIQHIRLYEKLKSTV
jgi:hypothetical protein